MRHKVLLTAGAEHDLEDIHDYIAASDSPLKATRLLDRLIVLASKLAELPERGAVSPELFALGIRDYRQVHLNPYRLIYRILDRRVVIYLIADSRRDLQGLLARRLLHPD